MGAPLTVEGASAAAAGCTVSTAVSAGTSVGDGMALGAPAGTPLCVVVGVIADCGVSPWAQAAKVTMTLNNRARGSHHPPSVDAAPA
jgi:hypothetical protein